MYNVNVKCKKNMKIGTAQMQILLLRKWKLHLFIDFLSNIRYNYFYNFGIIRCLFLGNRPTDKQISLRYVNLCETPCVNLSDHLKSPNPPYPLSPLFTRWFRVRLHYI